MISMKIIVFVTTPYKNFREFAVALLALPEFICTLFKGAAPLMKRQRILDIENLFITCKTRNDQKEEIGIQQEYDQFCR